MLLWLSERRRNVLGAAALKLARSQDWLISPSVILELEILHEIKRIKATADRVLSAAGQVGNLSISKTPFAEIAEASRKLSWTRDPIDRLVTAHAIADGARLLTADGHILRHFKDAVWD